MNIGIGLYAFRSPKVHMRSGSMKWMCKWCGEKRGLVEVLLVFCKENVEKKLWMKDVFPRIFVNFY